MASIATYYYKIRPLSILITDFQTCSPSYSAASMTWRAELTFSFGRSRGGLFFRVVIRFAMDVCVLAAFCVMRRRCFYLLLFLPFCLCNFYFRIGVLIAIARFGNGLSRIIWWFCCWHFGGGCQCRLGLQCLLFLLKLHLCCKFLRTLTTLWVLIFFKNFMVSRHTSREVLLFSPVGFTAFAHISTRIYPSSFVLNTARETRDHVLIRVIRLYLRLVMFKMFDF